MMKLVCPNSYISQIVLNSEFQTEGPAKVKAQVPKMLWQVRGTVITDHYSGPDTASGRVCV